MYTHHRRFHDRSIACIFSTGFDRQAVTVFWILI